MLQRVFILKRREDLRKMITLFAVFGAVFTVIVTIIGFGAKAGTLQGLLPEVATRDRVIVELMARMGRALALPLGVEHRLRLGLHGQLYSPDTVEHVHPRRVSSPRRYRRRPPGDPGADSGRGPVCPHPADNARGTLGGVLADPHGVSAAAVRGVFACGIPDDGPPWRRWSAGPSPRSLLGQLVPAYSSVMTLGAAIVLFAAGHVVDRHLARP